MEALMSNATGWPPLPGAYAALRYNAPVAACTLADAGLAETLARNPDPALAIVGTLATENLGIERVITNVLADPHIRFLVLCGAESPRTMDQLPGSSLLALGHSGVEQGGRIIGAPGQAVPGLQSRARGGRALSPHGRGRRSDRRDRREHDHRERARRGRASYRARRPSRTGSRRTGDAGSSP